MEENYQNNHKDVVKLFEKIKPSLIEKCGCEILKEIKIQAHMLFIDEKSEKFEEYFYCLSEQLKKYGVDIGNNPAPAISLYGLQIKEAD